MTDRKLKLNIDYDIIKIANLGFCAKSQDTMRYEFMDLRDVEMSLGVQFPELFRAINNSGMMDHLSHSREWVEDKIANDMNYVWLGDFFWRMDGQLLSVGF